MKMPILIDTKEIAEKEAYKFDCENANQICGKWIQCHIHNDNHNY